MLRVVFFQAEDGIRDRLVTGVQTCALPISLNALASALRGSIPPTPSAQRLQLGLPGYLILFAPLAFARQRQYQAREPPSPLVFFQISTHSTATPRIPLSSPVLK